MSRYIHATCIELNGTGILLQGSSGSGKSSLAYSLLSMAWRHTKDAALIGDDRILLSIRHGKMIAEGHPDIEGQIEIRGQGILRIKYKSAAEIGLVVDCVQEQKSRFPEYEAFISVKGVILPRIICSLNTISLDIIWNKVFMSGQI